MYDVLIIGAGASGLMAAWDLSIAGRKVAVIEAKAKIGGRIFDIFDPHLRKQIPLGAEFVHGDLALTKFLISKAGLSLYERTGDVMEFYNGELKETEFIEDYSLLKKKFKQLKHDISLQTFFDEYLNEPEHKELRDSLQRYAEGYYSGDIKYVSTFALMNEFENSSEKQYAIKEGYGVLLNYLYEELQKNQVDFFLSSPVEEIRWKENEVVVQTKDRELSATKILITVSLGVLESETIRFLPAVDQKIAAAKKLGFGNVIKIVLHFEKRFWQDNKKLSDLSFLFSHEIIPTWWTSHPQKEACLVGWLGGPPAAEHQNLSEEELTGKALQSLSHIFSIDLIHLQQMLIAAHSFNWITDPFTRGAYSYDVVNGTAYKNELLTPIQNTVFFSGEGFHIGPEIGTVEAALVTGRNAAQQILSSTV